MKRKAMKSAKEVINYFAEEIYRKGVSYTPKKRYDRLVCVDDDVFSAFVAAWYYHQIFKTHGYYPKIDCIGGYGLMSTTINPKIEGNLISEAEMLKYTLWRLGVKEEDIEIVCSEGTNTGQNLSAYAEELYNFSFDKQELLFCLTKRLVGRFYLTQIKQQPQMHADYVWKKQERERELYNGKKFANNLPYLSEAASIYDRYVRYTTGKQDFMEKLCKPLPEEIEDAGKYLCRKYKLKMPEFSLKKIWQFALTYSYYFTHKSKIYSNLEDNIMSWEYKLIEDFALANSLKKDYLFGGESLIID